MQKFKTARRADRLILLLAGFVVLLMPLWFFNSLLRTSLQRTRESSLSLLREELLQSAEKVRRALKPEFYVEDVLREVHREVLPQIPPDLIVMQPQKDFGHDIFDASLPVKMLQGLRRRGLDAILVHVDAPEFEKYHYWHSQELQKQCDEPDMLALSLSFINYITAVELHQKRYAKLWYRFTPVENLPDNIKRGHTIDKIKAPFAYLTRFSEMLGVHDRATEHFTDYFSQQSIFRYSFCCMSAVNLHGAYTVVVPQKSVRPQEMLKNAMCINNLDHSVSITDKRSNQSAFVVTPDGADYFIKAPSEFWNHLRFSGLSVRSAFSGSSAGFDIRISGRHKPAIMSLESQYSLFKLTASLLLIVYCAAAFHFWLFGLHLRLSVRRRLAMILGLIVILPVLGVGALTLLALRSFERVADNHLIQYTRNNLHEVALLNDENLLRQMGAGIEIKRRVESETSDEKDLMKSLERPEDDLKWFLAWTNSITECRDDGVITQYSGFRLPAPANRLVHSLVDKYMISLGLLKSGRKSDFSRTMTLGMLDNCVTSALEEAWMVHEGTVQRELTHTADTSRANLLVVKSGSGRYRLLYHRVSSLGEHVNKYLTSLAEKNPGWFVRRGLYGNVSVGVRQRKVGELFAYTWPPDCLLSPAMTFSFERAMSSRDHGHGVIKRDNELEVRAWRYEEGKSSILAATGKSDGIKLAFADLTAKMLLPALFGYAILLLYFVTSVIAEFINGPVRILNSGVNDLNDENYGVLIAGFSQDEFSKVTSAFNEMSVALKQREMIKRYVSRALLERVQTSDGLVSEEGKMIRVAVLASDIRSFTAISEKYSPAEVVDMLNSYFTSMESAISTHGGFIDKYIGDAIQAVFYDDPALDNFIVRAARSALQMRRNLAALNRSRREQGLFTIENGIGIDSGLVVSGSIGSENGRKDFTIVGRVIEQAALLESLTVNTRSRILISRSAIGNAGTGLITREFAADSLELLDVA